MWCSGISGIRGHFWVLFDPGVYQVMRMKLFHCISPDVVHGCGRFIWQYNLAESWVLWLMFTRELWCNAGEQLRHMKLSKCWCWALGVLCAAVGWILGTWVLGAQGSNSGVLVSKLWVLWLKCTHCVQLEFYFTIWGTKNGSVELAEGRKLLSSPCGAGWDLPKS